MNSMTSWNLLPAACLLILYSTGVNGESCPVYTRSGGFVVFNGYQSCSNGCCGSYPDYYCCALGSAAVAGIILGAIVLVCLSVFLCAYCLKKKSRGARVVRPVQPATTNTIVYTGTSGGYPMAHPPTHMPAPPPYKRHDSPPPYTEGPNYGAAASRGHHWGQPHPGTGMGHYPSSHGANHFGQQQPGTGTGHSPPTAGGSNHYGQQPAGTGTGQYQPPPYSGLSAPPTAAPGSSSAPPQHSYGQSHGWSDASVAPAPTPSTAPSTAPPSTASSTAPPGGRGSSIGSAPPRHHNYGQSHGWSASDASSHNRNTVVTNNIPRTLPPLPDD